MSVIHPIRDRRFKFTQLLNSMLEDAELSLKAKGFIAFCMKNKEGWEIYVPQVASVLKEGEKAIYSVINECIEAGYAYRYQPRAENGKLLPIKFFICDSKEEILLSKQEIESSPEFNKCLPDRHFRQAVEPQPQNGEAVSTGEKDPIYNNTNLNNIKEQQQQAVAAAPLISKKEETISPLLAEVDIPHSDKLEISRFSDNIIENALIWAKDPSTKITKNLQAALKWACQNPDKAKIPVPLTYTPKNYEGFNRSLWRNIVEVFKGNKILMINLEFKDYASTEYISYLDQKIYYGDFSFLDQIEHIFRKKEVNVLDLYKYLDHLRKERAKI